MADLFTAPPLPQTTDRTSYSVDLYNTDTFVMRTVGSLVCSYENLYSMGTSVYQGEFYWIKRIPTTTIWTCLYQLVPEMPIHTIPTCGYHKDRQVSALQRCSYYRGKPVELSLIQRYPYCRGFRFLQNPYLYNTDVSFPEMLIHTIPSSVIRTPL